MSTKAGTLTRRAYAQRNSVNVETRTLECIVSTDEIDAFGDVVSQDWKLDRFAANPVVLLSHDSRSLPIGSASNLRVVKSGARQQLECTVTFASEAATRSPRGRYTLPRTVTFEAFPLGLCLTTSDLEKRDGRDVMVLAANELHEISLTSIPANASALIKSFGTETRAAISYETMSASDALLNDIHAMSMARWADPDGFERSATSSLVEDAFGAVAQRERGDFTGAGDDLVALINRNIEDALAGVPS